MSLLHPYSISHSSQWGNECAPCVVFHRVSALVSSRPCSLLCSSSSPFSRPSPSPAFTALPSVRSLCFLAICVCIEFYLQLKQDFVILWSMCVAVCPSYTVWSQVCCCTVFMTVLVSREYVRLDFPCAPLMECICICEETVFLFFFFYFNVDAFSVPSITCICS